MSPCVRRVRKICKIRFFDEFSRKLSRKLSRSPRIDRSTDRPNRSKGVNGDSQNGYTAASRELVQAFLRRGLYPRYGVPNDMLLTCALNEARVMDISMEPVYDVGEESKLRPSRVALPIARLLIKGFGIRMYYRHILLETTPVPFAYLMGFISFISGFSWSV